MNSFFIYIGVKPTVFQLLYGTYPQILAIASSRYANNTRKTESVKNRTICSNMNINHTYGTPKILPKLGKINKLYRNTVRKESDRLTFQLKM